MPKHRIIIAILVALALPGCSSINRLTGQTDDSVLPGQREDAVPGKTTFPDEQASPQPVSPQTAAPDETPPVPEAECKADDPECTPAADGTFSDPQ